MGAGCIQQRASASRAGPPAAYLRPLGISVDLAPVLDVGDSRTSFLGDRIFSATPAKTALLGTAFASGVQSAHVVATAKHFPGLGTAPGKHRQQGGGRPIQLLGLRINRLASFRDAVKHEIRLLMVSNAEYPSLDPSRTPAALSKPIVTGLLRRSLEVQGRRHHGHHGRPRRSSSTPDAAVRASTPASTCSSTPTTSR